MARFGLQITKCPAEMKGEALDLLYRKVPSALRDRLIVQMLSEEQRGEINLSGLWVAQKRTGRLAGAMMTQALAGRVAAVWAPEVRSKWHRSTLAAAMVRQVVADFAASGFKLVQAVLDEATDSQASRDLENGGLVRVTELLYLERETATPLEFAELATVRESAVARNPAPEFAAAAGPSPGFEWRSFDQTIEAEFRSVLQATYTGSLDMPELEGARSLDDFLDGQKSACRYRADRWRLGQIPGDTAASAVLLLAESPGRRVWEVSYLGLTPAARGRRLGRAVLEHALELARAHVPWLELAVDVRNKPALRLYYSAGFVARERRTIHLAII
jgi:mycothiol synthase